MRRWRWALGVTGLLGAGIADAQRVTAGRHVAVPENRVVRDSVWDIVLGTYAGIRVPIESDVTHSGRPAAQSFLRAAGRDGNGRLVGWNPTRLPIAVAFRRSGSEAIDEGDSAAFWTILAQLEADVGMRLFVPSTMKAGDDPVDAILVAVKATAGDGGMTLITWTSGGDVYDARVFLRDRKTLHNPAVVTHEMVHALGFGHTTAWQSVMNPSSGHNNRLTVIDVAHVQLGLTSRVSAQRQDITRKLSLALERDPTHTIGPRAGCRYAGDPHAVSADYDVLAGFKSPAACNFCLCSVP